MKGPLAGWITADRAWLALFVPALLSYVSLLGIHLNHKKVVGSVERLTPEMDAIIPPNAKVVLVADGLEWAEGPLWVEDKELERSYLLFSDVKKNRVWKWEGGGGLFTIGKSLYLPNSGCREDTDPVRCGGLVEPGSNGLVQVPGSVEILLVMCEHGDRRVARLEVNGTKTPLATHYQGRPLNSPNDLVFSQRGDLYFTDPPYGLNKKEDDPEFQLGFSGVYRVSKAQMDRAKATDAGADAAGAPIPLHASQEPELLEAGLRRPNGLAFSPDFSHLYVANSDEHDPHWRVYEVTEDGGLVGGRVFMDAKPLIQEGRQGMPDGLTVDEQGNLLATGPGGVLVLSPSGQHLGTIFTGAPAANVAFGGDGYLYIAAEHVIQRIPILTAQAKTPAPPPG